MSTIINSELPDIEILTQLANRFFKTISSGELPNVSSAAFDTPIPAQPPSFSGAGVSPNGLLQPIHQINLDGVDFDKTTHAGNALPDSSSKIKEAEVLSASDFSGNKKEPYSFTQKDYFGTGKIPQSVTGSGKQPSWQNEDQSFDIDHPQTSLPDPHLTGGKIPQSVAGSGKQPSLQQNNKSAEKEALPYSNDNSFEQGLAEALAAIQSFLPSSQLPDAHFAQSSFYFLPKVNEIKGTDLQLPFSADKLLSAKAKNGIAPPFDVNLIRKDFPVLQEKINGKQLIWLDNAATTQKPNQVIDRLRYFYEHENSNIHRAAHELAARATDAYEAAREKVQRF